MRAAAGLAQVDLVGGRQVLDQLSALDAPPALRLRAAAVVLQLMNSAGPLKLLALDESAAVEQCATAIEVLVNHDDADLRTLLASLATADSTPPRVQAAAASVLPDAEARAVLTSIATSDMNPAVRVAAIGELDAIDSKAASKLLSGADARVIEERLGDLEDGLLRWSRNVILLAMSRPEVVLAPASARGSAPM
ncbi:hypothetical protein ACWKSP_07290 [Micromonosporaceae bacterium Da 78-11]